MTEHPGTVEWVEIATGAAKTVPADEVPEEIRWADGPDGRPWPVTRIETLTLEDRREIRQFAPDGTLLLTTYQRREA